MASTRLRVPHDYRVASATVAALVVAAAVIIFLMIMLAHNVGAY